MRTFTTCGRWLAVFLTVVCLTGTAYAQRTVTLTLNTATIPDTTNTTDFIEVRGAVDSDGDGGLEAPFTFTNGGATIDWSDMSTIEPVNIGGDYWQTSFQIDNETDVTFKFYSQQTQDALDLDGWEVDPNPRILAGTSDTTLAVHYFEFNGSYRGLTGDKGDYDWRPYEPKEDSVAVWFRVFGCTTDGQAQGYNPGDPAQSLTVRGDPLGGVSMLTWGDDTGVSLQREGSVDGAAGYDLYSGVGYYPASAAGMEQPYKFLITPEGWESSPDRTFTIPASDSTLHWDYFGQSSPTVCGALPTAGSVVFSVDTTPLEEIGLFDKARGDTLQVRGGFNGWDCDNPDDCLLANNELGTNIFEADVPLVLIPGTEQAYKFFIDFNDENFRAEFGVDPPSGWEEPLTTQGSDRKFEYGAMSGQFLGDKRFNDVFEGNIIPGDVSVAVTFTVDMTPATDPSLPVPFDAAVDTPYVFLGGDAIWAFTQGLPAPDGTEGFDEANLLLSDDDGDMIYTGTLTLTGPTYSAIQYQYGYAGNNEPGTGTSSLGRRRTRFVAANADGTWPATWDFVAESFQPESGALPFESNPVTVGVEAINDEVPESVWLGANYPNPFNPTTTFEYAVDRAQNVTILVYDMLGRVVATLVNGMQPPATYQVSFDASNLASGVYFYRLETQSKVISKRMLLVK